MVYIAGKSLLNHHYHYRSLSFPFSALTLKRQEGHPACKNSHFNNP